MVCVMVQMIAQQLDQIQSSNLSECPETSFQVGRINSVELLSHSESSNPSPLFELSQITRENESQIDYKRYQKSIGNLDTQ